MTTGLIIPNAPPRTCGNCAWGAPLADLAAVECQALPPSLHILGATQTVKGIEYQTQLMRPNLPRTLKACSLFERKAANGT
jgi:hypothetical protein